MSFPNYGQEASIAYMYEEFGGDPGTFTNFGHIFGNADSVSSVISTFSRPCIILIIMGMIALRLLLT